MEDEFDIGEEIEAQQEILILGIAFILFVYQGALIRTFHISFLTTNNLCEFKH